MVSVLHASAWYPPAHVGGTEVYLRGLVRELRAHCIYSRIVSPLGGQHPDSYEFDGTTVRTYEVNTAPSRAELQGIQPVQGLGRFREILMEERPDIYHQHSWTRGLGAAHLGVARELGLRTVLTVHVPNNVCMRGTMMRFGQSACDGHIDAVKCAECWSQGRGAPKLVAQALARVPLAFSSALRRAAMDGRVATALSARHLVGERRAEFADMVVNSDRIVAVCQWLCDALTRNGVPAGKVVLSRQGVDENFAVSTEARGQRNSNRRSFRLLYIGRWHRVKGIHVLVEAVKRIPQDIPLELIIHGIGDGPEERAYESEVRHLSAGDARIHFSAAIPRERLVDTYLQADAVAVPSLWMETGPMVVLEAKATGTPIIGSRLGGIAELVHEPEEGILVRPGHVQAWADVITTMACSQTPRRYRGTTTRTMQDVAKEMAALYQLLC
jgi:glycosyltransferase involved in cell wall biosynthesis